jgi:hypothetical protein
MGPSRDGRKASWFFHKVACKARQNLHNLQADDIVSDMNESHTLITLRKPDHILHLRANKAGF